MRLAPISFGALCALAAAPLACGLDRAGTQPPPDQVTATGGYGATGAGGTGLGGTGAGGTGAGGTGGQPAGCGGGYDCVPAPVGATHVVVTGDGSCPAGWDTPHSPLYAGVDPGCATCSCAAPDGSCSHGTVYRHSNSSCSDLKQTHTPSDDECIDVHESSDSQQADSYYVEVEPTEVGCPATVAQPEDLTIHDTCEIGAPPAAGCGAGNACVPSVAPTNPLCVLLSGHVSCPAGYANARSLYGGISDSRSCQCSCTAPTGSSCTGAFVRLYADTVCGGQTTQELYADQCRDTSGANWHDSFEFEAGTYQPGSCTPIEDHAGQVDFSDPVTLCCEP